MSLMNTPPSKQLNQFVVRLPDGMRDAIKAAAEHNNRSMNAEIVMALDYWLQLEVPYEVAFGPKASRQDAQRIGREDWEDGRQSSEKDLQREIDNAISLLQRLHRDLKVRAREGDRNDDQI